MKVLISGASGMIGSALQTFLRTQGHEVMTLTRNKNSVSEQSIFWDPEKGELEIPEGTEAVVNLAGERIDGIRWTKRKKERILQSRLLATSTLVRAVGRMSTPPSVFVSASAIGYYGSPGDKWCDEEAVSGTGFLAHVCEEWEREAENVGGLTRLVTARIGVVVAKQGGILPKVLVPFRLGLGGVLGTGKQWMSWIMLDDVLGAILHILIHKELEGPVNLVAPEPVTNQQWTETLGSILHRPTFCSLPKWLLRPLFGEMADELFLSSTRARPEKLLLTGYSFLWPSLAPALKYLLD